MSWRAGALVREAWLNVVTSPWRTGGLVLAVAAIFGGLASLELRDANELTEFQENFARSGDMWRSGYLRRVRAIARRGARH